MAKKEWGRWRSLLFTSTEGPEERLKDGRISRGEVFQYPPCYFSGINGSAKL